MTATESPMSTGEEFRAVHRYAVMADTKARKIVDMIRGLNVNDALDLLRNDKHRGSRLVERVLASAVANALQNPTVRPNRLVVSRTFVQGGPVLQNRMRFRPGPMGRYMPFRRRTCHIHIYLADPQASSAEQASDTAE